MACWDRCEQIDRRWLFPRRRTSSWRAPPPASTVVLLHGLGRRPASLWLLGRRLSARGHRVCNLGYDSRAARFESLVDDLEREVGRRVGPVERLDFVTHSLGGLVLRGLLARAPERASGRAVMLAPPNQGSEIIDALRHTGMLGRVLGPLATRLGTREEDLPRRLPVPSIPFGVIAGSRWVNPLGALWLPSPHDGAVSVASTRLEGMADHLVLRVTHPFLMNSPEVTRQVEAFLRHGRFERASSEPLGSDAARPAARVEQGGAGGVAPRERVGGS